MDQLAGEAGITKPILYSHFGDRAGLAEALAERTSDMLISTLSESLESSAQLGNPREVVRSSLDAFCTFIEKEPSIYRFLVRSALDTPNPISSRLVRGIGDEITKLLNQGFRLAHVDNALAEPWGLAIVGMGFVGAEWWIDNNEMTKDDLVDYLTKLVWGGLAGAGMDRIQPDA
jgi:AcrR family transcriptional regulator